MTTTSQDSRLTNIRQTETPNPRTGMTNAEWMYHMLEKEPAGLARLWNQALELDRRKAEAAQQ